MSDDKNKVAIYHSLGKCKIQLAVKDPLIVLILLSSIKKRSNVSKKFFNSAIELMEMPSIIWDWSVENLRTLQLSKLLDISLMLSNFLNTQNNFLYLSKEVFVIEKSMSWKILLKIFLELVISKKMILLHILT